MSPYVGAIPLTEEAKRNIERARALKIDEVAETVHAMIAHGCRLIPSDLTLKLLQEVHDLKRRVEPQNADHQQVVYALERARAVLQAEADELADRHDYAAEFPFEDAKRMEEAIAILTKPKPVLPPQRLSTECKADVAELARLLRVPVDLAAILFSTGYNQCRERVR